jgi:hypothetical protein
MFSLVMFNPMKTLQVTEEKTHELLPAGEVMGKTYDKILKIVEIELDDLKGEIIYRTKKAVDRGEFEAYTKRHHRVHRATFHAAINWLQNRGYSAGERSTMSCHCSSHVNWSWNARRPDSDPLVTNWIHNIKLLST